MIARSTLAAVALFALSPSARAQPDAGVDSEPTADLAETPTVAVSPEDQAAAAFDQGKRAFLEDDYERALLSFEEAQRLAPHDVVRFNIALCLERLGRFRRALDEYRHAEASTQLDDANRADAAERADRVEARLGTLVLSGPAGTRLEVVGVEECTAPCRVAVDPGAHEVRRVEDPSDSRSVAVERGAEEVVDFGGHEEGPPPPRGRGGLHLKIGLVGWIGAGVAVLGALSTIAFGIRAEGLHDHYLQDPTPSRRDSGRTAVVVTNVSWVVAVLGAAALAVDVLVLEPRRAPTSSPPGEAVALSF